MDSKKYHRAHHVLFLLDTVLSLGFLLSAQYLGVSFYLKSLALSISPNQWIQILIYVAAFFTLYYFLFLPLSFLSGFVLEKKFSLSNESFWQWAGDQVKKFLLSIAFFVLTAESFYFFIIQFPDIWWVAAGIGWLFLTLLLTGVFPILIIPIFYPMKIMGSGELTDKLMQLCGKCGVRVMGIYEIALSKKTKKANAALVGLGKTRRVILGDTLIGNFTPPEIEMVLAHELGHHVKKHILRGFLFNTLTAFLGFYLLRVFSENVVALFGGQGLSDLSIFPAILILSFVAGLVLMPLQNGFSRLQEKEADRFAIETIPSKEIFISLMEKLGRLNLADIAPNPWIERLLYDHPSISNRIKYANKFFEGRAA